MVSLKGAKSWLKVSPPRFPGKCTKFMIRQHGILQGLQQVKATEEQIVQIDQANKSN